MPRFYVILELSWITRSRTAILMFLDAFQRFHKREREKKEEGNAIIYVEEEKERESLRKRVENSYVRGEGNVLTGAKWSKTRLSFSSLGGEEPSAGRGPGG